MEIYSSSSWNIVIFTAVLLFLTSTFPLSLVLKNEKEGMHSLLKVLRTPAPISRFRLPKGLFSVFPMRPPILLPHQEGKQRWRLWNDWGRDSWVQIQFLCSILSALPHRVSFLNSSIKLITPSLPVTQIPPCTQILSPLAPPPVFSRNPQPITSFPPRAKGGTQGSFMIGMCYTIRLYPRPGFFLEIFAGKWRT